MDMPVLRKHRTPDEIAAAEEKKRQEKIIHHWQVLAMDNLYFRDKAIQDFIVALREHCAYEAGTTASIDEMSTAIGMVYKKTCEMLEQLEYTGVGHLVRNRPIVDDNRPYTRFYWKADFHELIEKFIEMREKYHGGSR